MHAESIHIRDDLLAFKKKTSASTTAVDIRMPSNLREILDQAHTKICHIELKLIQKEAKFKQKKRAETQKEITNSAVSMFTSNILKTFHLKKQLNNFGLLLLIFISFDFVSTRRVSGVYVFCCCCCCIQHINMKYST